MLRRIAVKMALVPILAFTLVACQKKAKTDAMANDPAGQSGVESTPLNFDPAGSDSGKISGLTTVYFEFDRSTLSSDARAALQSNADWMKKNANVRVQIEGHTDSRGSIEYNLALGERRANAVKSYMASLGIPGNRLSVISYGEEKPLAMGETEEAWSKNRRANFVPVQ